MNSYPVVPSVHHASGSVSSGARIFSTQTCWAPQLAEPLEVPVRVEHPVDVVDADADDGLGREELAQQLVGLPEHLGLLHPERDEPVDVEKRR